MKDNIERRLIGFFVLMLVILVYIVDIGSAHSQRYMKSEDWVNKTHDVINHSAEIVSYLHAGDAALRTFMITGDARDQAAYRTAYSTMIERRDELDALTRSGEGEEDIHARIPDIDNLLSNRVEIARSIARAREQGGTDSVKKLYLSGPDIESIGKIERYIATLMGAERDLLRQRDAEEHAQAVSNKWVIYTGVAVDFVLMAFAFGLLRDDLRARRLAAKALEDANAQLETKVQERALPNWSRPTRRSNRKTLSGVGLTRHWIIRGVTISLSSIRLRKWYS